MECAAKQGSNYGHHEGYIDAAHHNQIKLILAKGPFGRFICASKLFISVEHALAICFIMITEYKWLI